MSRQNSSPRRIAHMAEGAFSLRNAKMSVGVIRYAEHQSVAVIDSTQAGRRASEVIGCGGDLPIVSSLTEALAHSPDTFLLGTTPTGGRVPDAWKEIILEAIDRGLHIWAGMHDFLSDDPRLADAARKAGVELWDIRKPARDLPVGGGLCRWAKSPICLAVGTDCALGKMTACLEIDRVAKARGINSAFIATGQTGIAIAGWGSPIDAIPGDFMAGAVERDILSVDGSDLILVEGQGSLLHPGFSSVTLALLHGACADSLLLCHEVQRDSISKILEVPIPSLKAVAELYLRLAEPIKPTRVAAVALKTTGLSDAEARDAVKRAEDEMQVPASDPVRFGAERLFEAIHAVGKRG